MTGTAEVYDTSSVDVWANPDHDDWAGLAARTGLLFSRVAGRTDVITRVSPAGTGSGAAACFIPALAEARFSAARLIPDYEQPNRIDPAVPADRARVPVYVGAVIHEAGHAGHTKVVHELPCSAAAQRWAVLLEEPRIEAAVLAAHPGYRKYLRASFRQVVVGDSDPSQQQVQQSRAGTARLLVLTLGRVHAGVLDAADLPGLREAFDAMLGADTTAELDKLVGQAVQVGDHDAAAMADVAERFSALVGQDTTPGTDGDDATLSGAGNNTDPTENSDGSAAEQFPCGGWTPGDLPEISDADANSDASSNDDDTWGPDPIGELIDKVTRQVSDTAAADSRPAITITDPHAADTVAAHAASVAVFGAVSTATLRNVGVTLRAPTSDDHRQAAALTAKLRGAGYRGAIRTTTSERTPPGRIRMGELMRHQRQIAARVTPTARPFAATRRTAVERPPLKLGVSLDISGSMDGWVPSAAALAWAVAHATRHVKGIVAAVGWDDTVTGIIRPRHRPAAIPEPAEYGAGSSGCALSMRALDGALQYRHGDAAVLLILTDGAIGGRADIQQQIRSITGRGVRVLWVSTRRDGWAPAHVTRVDMPDPEQFGGIIGAALVGVLAET